MYRTVIRKIIKGLHTDPFLCISFAISIILFIANTITNVNYPVANNIIFQYFMQTMQIFLLILSLYNLGAKKNN